MLHSVDDRSIVISVDRDGDRTEIFDAHALLKFEQGLGGGFARVIYRVVAEWKAILNQISAMNARLIEEMTYFINNMDMGVPRTRG